MKTISLTETITNFQTILSDIASGIDAIRQFLTSESPERSMMEMSQTYQGYFLLDGRFVADDQEITIPAMRRVIVNILDDELIETKAEKQRKAFEEFVQTIAGADPLGEEFDQIISRGIHVRGELDL